MMQRCRRPTAFLWYPLTPTRIMKKCKEIVLESDIGQNLRLQGVVSNLDGAAVQKVPANRLPAKFGFMLCHPLACTAPVKLSSAVLHENPPGVSGWLVEGRYNYGAFVTDNKKKGIDHQATT